MAEQLLIGLTLILVLGIVARWVAWRWHLPGILLLLVVGIAAGPVGGFLKPDEIFGDLLIPLVSMSVAVILFEGGLSLSLRDLREIGSVVRNLVTLGVIVTWMLAAGGAYLLLDFDPLLSLLFGAILVVTGPTVIIPLLRHVRPKAPVGNIVKWEGILNDPIGALLAVLVYEGILAGGFPGGPRAVVAEFMTSVGIGCLVGLLGAALMVLLLKFYWVPDFLQNALSLTVVLSVFTASNTVQAESGLLATTVMGTALANQKFAAVKHIVEFKENLRVLMISSIFIILSARLEISELTQLGWRDFVFLGLLMVVVRPVAVALSALGSQLGREGRLFLAWMAPRGVVAAAIASIFSARLVEIGYEQAERLVPITFLVIIGTVTIYGLGALPVAQRLGISEPKSQGALLLGAHRFARAIAAVLRSEDIPVVLVDTNRANVAAARMEGFPAYYGSILSERVLDEINLYGIGRLLALTSNDEANSLAALHFAEIFGRAEVYQLSPGKSDKSTARRSTSPPHLNGRFLFGPDVTFARLAQMFEDGWTIKKTPITDKFNYKAFREKYGESAIPLFLIGEQGLSVLTADSERKPRPGQTLIGVVRETEKDAQAERRRKSVQQA